MTITQLLQNLDQTECTETLNITPLFGEDLLNEMDLIEAEMLISNVNDDF